MHWGVRHEYIKRTGRKEWKEKSNQKKYVYICFSLFTWWRMLPSCLSQHHIESLVSWRQKMLSLHLAFVYLLDAKHTSDKWRYDQIAMTKKNTQWKEWKAKETKQQSQGIIADIVKRRRRRRRRRQRRKKNCLLCGWLFSHCSFATSQPWLVILIADIVSSVSFAWQHLMFGL